MNIRKPKFLRNEIAMEAHIAVADNLITQLAQPNITMVERYRLMKLVDDCWEKAAEEGGFFSVKDLLAWMDSQKSPA